MKIRFPNIPEFKFHSQGLEWKLVDRHYPFGIISPNTDETEMPGLWAAYVEVISPGQHYPYQISHLYKSREQLMDSLFAAGIDVPLEVFPPNDWQFTLLNDLCHAPGVEQLG